MLPAGANCEGATEATGETNRLLHIHPLLTVVKLIYFNLSLLTQNQVKEELEKEKSNVEELNNAKNVLEGNNSKLTSDLKALTEKNEKVSYHIFLLL